MKLSKFFLGFSLVLCILLSCAACGSGSKTTTDDNPQIDVKDFNTGIGPTEESATKQQPQETASSLSDGPIFYSGSVPNSFTLYQYSLKTHEWKTLFDYDRGNKSYTINCGGVLFFDDYKNYLNEQIFSPDVTKLAISGTIQGESHAGYLDTYGNFTSISARVHSSSSDFYGKSINDVCPCFTSTGLFFFYSRSEQLCYYYDLEKRAVVKTVELETDNSPYLSIFLDGNDSPKTDTSRWSDPSTPYEYWLHSNNYRLFAPQDYLRGPNGAIFFQIIKPLYAKSQYVSQVGPGIGSPYNHNGETYWDSDESGEIITSDTDYDLRKLACSGNKIAFTGRKGTGNYTLFLMEYDFNAMKASAPETICTDIPKDYVLLFWKD